MESPQKHREDLIIMPSWPSSGLYTATLPRLIVNHSDRISLEELVDNRTLTDNDLVAEVGEKYKEL